LTKEELTVWALANGERVFAGHPSLTKSGPPNAADDLGREESMTIVRVGPRLHFSLASVHAARPGSRDNASDEVAVAPYTRITKRVIFRYGSLT
jgi:hypothetical protein